MKKPNNKFHLCFNNMRNHLGLHQKIALWLLGRCPNCIFKTTGCPKVECAFWKCYCSKTVQHIDSNWCFLNSQHYYFWYSNLTFAKKKREMKKFSIWKKILIFFDQNFFSKFFWNFFFALNQPKKRFESEKFFSKNFKKILWYKFFIVFKLKFFVFPFSFFKG